MMCRLITNTTSLNKVCMPISWDLFSIFAQSLIINRNRKAAKEAL